MKFLFFIVHPSKVHLYRLTINKLITNGHRVSILITKKDVLEYLVQEEGWNYTNIFPEGRKVQGWLSFIGTGLNFLKTFWRLYLYTKDKKFDLFITDDALGIIGRIRNIPTIHFVDDDWKIIGASKYLLYFVTHILAPYSTNLGKLEKKRIGFDGYKQSAYLRPKHFLPQKSIIKSFNPKYNKYFIIRLVSLSATHDIGKRGISNELLLSLIDTLEHHGQVYITSERELPQKFRKYKLKLDSKDILHALYFAEMIICDSQTMAAEAGMVGTPFIRFNDFIGKIGCLNDIERVFKLGFGIKRHETIKLFNTMDFLLNSTNLEKEWKIRKQNMINNTIDLSEFMIWLFENYPKSINIIKANPNYQSNFK